MEEMDTVVFMLKKKDKIYRASSKDTNGLG